eukprot:Plantae.Rhodophyta-Purpureofilum_apyrenoidigerum.ctg54648.p1 GENE.Plantae.Rhodophyta-Purpureofilum_apyrenoidigerum.ctg54648~~Plantae.Rhodophyta-Purpureofilum_apyrenoidigerum.ctg54648.p1  ORF type:complete len:214 (+),score=37.87 Plantae.Rhodophyta-Purpureofilum_apyrenoidigerum.ctg54648:256-897(+)
MNMDKKTGSPYEKDKEQKSLQLSVDDFAPPVVLNYLFSDTLKRWVSVATTTTVIMTVVSLLCIMEGVFSQLPLLIVRFAELNMGETDLYITADVSRVNLSTEAKLPAILAEIGQSNRFGFLNERFISNRVWKQSGGDVIEFSEIAPRTFLPVSVRAKNAESNISTQATLLVYNDDVEKRAGIGRSWNRRKLNEIEVHASKHVSGPTHQSHMSA